MPTVEYKANDDGTHTFYVVGEVNDLQAIQADPNYDEGRMKFHQAVYINGKHTVVFKERNANEAPPDPRVSELREYARKHFGTHARQAGGSRDLSNLNLEMEHPDIFAAKLEGAGIRISQDED